MAVSTMHGKISNIEENKNNNRKRITPFSIDDILSESRSHTQSSIGAANDVSFLEKTKLSSSVEESDTLCFWNQETYSRWLDSIQRLCAFSALQPFWYPDYCVKARVLNDCRQVFGSSRPHPYSAKETACTSLKPVVNSRPRKNGNKVFCKKSHTVDNILSESKETKPSQSVRQSSKPQSLNDDNRLSSLSTDSEDGTSVKSSEEKECLSESPLGALEKLTCITFKGMEEKQHLLQVVVAGREAKAKRRKCRTAFTAFQLSVLEQRFNCHKYLTPNDRDQIAHILGLSAPQVITWFQNRRAKEKRDLEEMRNDIKTVGKWTQRNQNEGSLSPVS